ncbi:hypothetical protein SPOG_03653 [Schizosaccharomyces cryophilus OY26]|uniref:Uncharacterized protein n=1 Tax=Schizosaccharomyces cryophilus (strain OY26 / ATCC MYA-4695 / CBS 11777 / NBRC 106824 / NRRL Y48691) TaxID=653667 RepID=S9X7M8_SCHCR|nr:uncharacterized protein SPOG_03653 [Schizosaccharomyces cryophilus OY26]EPY53112.1 hypothetical protein SPOG_03653 [Schizosaccharomyces cryophilus OY26]
MDAVLQNFFQNVFEVSDLILLFSALSLAFKLHNLPETALNYCDNIRLTPKGLAEEYYDKVEKLIELNSFMIHPISIEVLQHLVLHAAKDFLDPSPEKILNLTRAIHYLDGIISEGSHSSATPEEIWKLTMTLKNIDSLVCIFFQTSPFMQKDIVEAQLVRLNNSFSETMFQKLLNSLCNQGLAMYKSARYLSVEEYIHNVNENEVKISLLLMEIDLKAYTPQNPMSKIQCFFLKYVLWTLKVLLYQPVITLSDEDFDKVQLLKEKLAESLVYCFRLSMDSFQEICEVGAPSFFFFDTLKKIFSLLFCRNEKYSYRNELFESMKLMKQLALKIDLAYSLKIIDDLTTISNCVYQKDYTKAGDLGDFEAIDSEIDHFCEFLFSNFYENSFSSI